MTPERTLTDADIEALAKALSASHCSCPFTNDEVSGVRALLAMMNETKSTIIKGVVGALLAAIFIVIVLGAKVWVRQ